MPKFSACIEMLFTEVPFEERFALVKQAGLPAVEFWGWRKRDLNQIQEKLAENKLELAGFTANEMSGFTVWQDTSAVAEEIIESVEVAGKMGAKSVIVVCGNENPDLSHEAQSDRIAETIAKAAPAAQKSGVKLGLEMLNTYVDHKGYFLKHTSEGLQIVEKIASPAVGLLYDIYHMQIMEGNIIDTLTKIAPHLVHIHLGGVPGRHETFPCELDYHTIYAHLDQLGFVGYAGFEYRPTMDSALSIQQCVSLKR